MKMKIKRQGIATARTEKDNPFARVNRIRTIKANNEKITEVSTLLRFFMNVLNTTGRSRKSTNNSPKKRTLMSLYDKEKTVTAQAPECRLCLDAGHLFFAFHPAENATYRFGGSGKALYMLQLTQQQQR